MKHLLKSILFLALITPTIVLANPLRQVGEDVYLEAANTGKVYLGTAGTGGLEVVLNAGSTAPKKLSLNASTGALVTPGTVTAAGAIGGTALQASSSISVNDGTVNFAMNLTGNATVFGTTTNHPLNFYVNAGNYWSLTTTGHMAGVNSGSTIAIEDDTAASACAGNVTATGTTAVTISTTCIGTGDRVILSRSSAPSGTAQCWYDTIVDGTSFNLDCSGAETGTFSWWILKQL